MDWVTIGVLGVAWVFRNHDWLRISVLGLFGLDVLRRRNV